MPRGGRKNSIPPVVTLPAQGQQPPSPKTGEASLYFRRRAGYDFLEITRESGRDIAMQPHLGINRIAFWTPASGTNLTVIGLANTLVGTRGTPTPAVGGVGAASRRWSVTSAATAGAAAEERGATPFMWRGDQPGRGGFISILRFRTTQRRAGCNAFFGLHNNAGAAAVIDLMTNTHTQQYVGVGFKEGVHANYQIIYKGAGTGALNFIDLGPDFPVDNGNAVYTVYIFTPQNGGFIGVRVVREDTPTPMIAEYTLDNQALIPEATALLTPRLHMDNNTTAATVIFECYGVYCETDY